MRQFFKSKRFFFTIISVILFCVGVFGFQLPPLDVAGAITILTAPYLVSESIKPSKKE